MKKNTGGLTITDEEFREIGYRLIDSIADHFSQLRDKKVSPGVDPKTVRDTLGRGSFPEEGEEPASIINRATDLLMANSLLDGHPRFWGYIIGAGTQIGALADLLAAAVNPNCGGWDLSPMASEIEQQVVKWIAEWVHYGDNYGGLLVSGGTMANYVGFLVAKTKVADWEIRSRGLSAGRNMKVYCSEETHTWIQKATDLFGLGTDAIRWIPAQEDLRMDPEALRAAIESDKVNGDIPMLVVATAGTVSTGVVDDLDAIGTIARDNGAWFHIDAAYGGPAAQLESCRKRFKGFETADSIALDPHKWFYTPQEAGCVLVRDQQYLIDTFSYTPPYYHFEEFDSEQGVNFYELGPQNSRGFRALKVWMTLLQAGKAGMRDMIANDIALAKKLYNLLDELDDFEVFQTNLSITTFQFVPNQSMTQEALNDLNKRLMVALQFDGRFFVTNAVKHGKYLMRACIVNFRTTEEDIMAFPGVVRDVYTRMGLHNS